MSFAYYAVTKDKKILYKSTKKKCQRVFDELVTETMKKNNIWKIQPAKNKKVGEEI